MAVLVGVLAVAVAAGALLWDLLGVMAVPIDIVLVVVLVRLLRPVLLWPSPARPLVDGVRRDGAG